MLHVIDYIARHSFPINYDGSRGDNFSNSEIKNYAKINNKEKNTLNFDISCRISEGYIVGHISTIYYQKNGRWVSKYCNETDIMMNISPVVKYRTKASRPRFRLNMKIELSNV